MPACSRLKNHIPNRQQHALIRDNYNLFLKLLFNRLSCAVHFTASGNAELIDILLSAGSQPLASDNLGATPLHGAVFACSVVAAETPLAATRLPTAEDANYGKLKQLDDSSRGRSPSTSKTTDALHNAITVLDKMASRVKGQLNGADSYGRTALVWAVSLGRTHESCFLWYKLPYLITERARISEKISITLILMMMTMKIDGNR